MAASLSAQSGAARAHEPLTLAAAVVPAPGMVAVTVDATRSRAPVNRALLGVDGPGPAGAGPAMSALGMSWVRTDVGFEHSYDCSTGSWNPTSLDGRVAQILRMGAQPLLIVDYTPSCLAPIGPVPAPGTVAYEPPDVGTSGGVSDRTVWDGLVDRMASHEIARGVRAFEIWNEPDGTFWYGGLPGYLHLYQDTATVLELAAAAARVHVEVGGPALVFPDWSWIEPFLSFVAAQGLPLDFLSWHYYGNYPLLGPYGPVPKPPVGGPAPWYNPALRAQVYGTQVQQVRAEVAKFPSLRPLLWIDEWNVDAGFDPRQDGPFGAAFAAAVLDSVQGAGIDRMAFFDVADNPADPLGDWGMMTADFVPKPVYRAFAFWHALSGAFVGVGLSPDQSAADSIGRVGAVASLSPRHSLTVLLYDFAPFDPTGGYGTNDPTPFDHLVDLRAVGLKAGSYHWSRMVLDASHAGTVVAQGTVRGPSADIRLQLAGEGLALVSFVPSS